MTHNFLEGPNAYIFLRVRLQSLGKNLRVDIEKSAVVLKTLSETSFS